jgi:hypothetical protein
MVAPDIDAVGKADGDLGFPVRLGFAVRTHKQKAEGTDYLTSNRPLSNRLSLFFLSSEKVAFIDFYGDCTSNWHSPLGSQA